MALSLLRKVYSRLSVGSTILLSRLCFSPAKLELIFWLTKSLWRGFYYIGAPLLCRDEFSASSLPHGRVPGLAWTSPPGEGLGDAEAEFLFVVPDAILTATILWLKMASGVAPAYYRMLEFLKNVPQHISLKISALERIRDSRLQVDRAQTLADRKEALALYDQAIKHFQRLVDHDKVSLSSTTRG